MSLTVKTDDVTKGRKDADPHWAVTGGSGVNGLLIVYTAFRFFVLVHFGLLPSYIVPRYHIVYPGYQRFFLACDGELPFFRPQAEDTSGEARVTF